MCTPGPCVAPVCSVLRRGNGGGIPGRRWRWGGGGGSTHQDHRSVGWCWRGRGSAAGRGSCRCWWATAWRTSWACLAAVGQLVSASSGWSACPLHWQQDFAATRRVVAAALQQPDCHHLNNMKLGLGAAGHRCEHNEVPQKSLPNADCWKLGHPGRHLIPCVSRPPVARTITTTAHHDA